MVPAHLSYLLNTCRGIGTETYGLDNISSWWPQIWFRCWTLIVLLYAFSISMPNWWGNGSPLVACPFHTRVVLHQMLAVITKYQVINTWNALTAYMIFHKLISNVYSSVYLMSTSVYLRLFTSWECFCPQTFANTGSNLRDPIKLRFWIGIFQAL